MQSMKKTVISLAVIFVINILIILLVTRSMA